MIEGIAVGSEGSLVLAADFTKLDGGPFTVIIAKLTSGGAVDSTFSPVGLEYSGIGVRYRGYGLCLQADGNVLLSGWFWRVNGTLKYSTYILRLRSDGIIDETFVPEFSYPPNLMLQEAGGKLLFAGGFLTVNGVRKSVVRLNLDGTVDSAFDVGAGVENVPGSTWTIHDMALGPSGDIFVAGSFSFFDGFVADNVVKLFSGDRLLPLAPRILPGTVRGLDGSRLQFRVERLAADKILLWNAAPAWIPASGRY